MLFTNRFQSHSSDANRERKSKGQRSTSRNGRFQVSMFIQYLFRCPWAGVLPDGETRWISQVSLHTIFLSPSS